MEAIRWETTSLASAKRLGLTQKSMADEIGAPKITLAGSGANTPLPQAPEPDPDEPEPIGEERAPESRPVRLRVSSPGAGLNVRDAPGGRILCTVGDGEEPEAAGDPVGGWQPVRLTAYVMAEFAEPADE